MRRRLTGMTVLASVAALVLALPGGSLAQDDPTEIKSDDGMVTLRIPAGAAPDGVEVSIVRRDPSEAPSPIDPAQARPFYEISPVDITFAEPVRVTRRIDQAGLGTDPTAAQPLPLIATLLHADGDWRWLDGQRVHYTWAGPEILVIGRTMTGGQLLPTSSAVMLLAPDDDMIGAVDGLSRSKPSFAARPTRR